METPKKGKKERKKGRGGKEGVRDILKAEWKDEKKQLWLEGRK